MEVVLPLLSKSKHRLAVGENFFLAFSPERVDPGRTDWNTRTTPKVIGGVTPDCLEVAQAFYGRSIDTLVPVSSTEAAEMVKLLETPTAPSTSDWSTKSSSCATGSGSTSGK